MGGEMKRIRGKKQPLTATGLQALGDDNNCTIASARAQAPETLTLERTLSGGQWTARPALNEPFPRA